MKYFRVITIGLDEFVVVANQYSLKDLSPNNYESEMYYVFTYFNDKNVVCSIKENSVKSISEELPYK